MPGLLQFDAASHTYTVDGVAVPSVTQVLESVGIIDYGHLPGSTREMALERGRMVHLVCELYDRDDLEEVPAYLQPYLDAWIRFRGDTGFAPQLIEHREYNGRFGYAGTLDRTGIIQGAPALLDIKTSHAPWWAAAQTAAYAAFFDKPAKQRRFAVALHDDGSYKLTPYRCQDFAADFNVFQAALTVFRAKQTGGAR